MRTIHHPPRRLTTFDDLVAVLRPYEGYRVRLTFVARGASGHQPQISGVLKFWNPPGRDDVNDPQIGGRGGFFYAEGCVVEVETIAGNGRYVPA